MVAGPVLIVMAAILGIGLTVFSWLQTLLAGRRSVATVRAMHATPSGLGAAQQRTLHGIAGLSAGIGTAVMVITGLLYGYMSAVGVSAVLVMPQPRLFAVGWVVLRIATMLLVVLFAWEMERVWYCRADIVGVRRVICVMVALGTLATLMTLSSSGPILAVILPMCAGKWGLAGRLRWWSGCGAMGRLRWPGYGRPTYISRGVRYTVNG